MQHSTIDAYAEALIIQNKGGVCPHCKSALGHYSYCGLINREVGETQRAAEAGNISKEDAERMKVSIERFKTGGGWYLNVDDRTVAALLPDDIEYITKRFGPTSKFKLVHDAVEAEYALEMETKKLGVELTNRSMSLLLSHRDCIRYPKHGGKR